MGLVERVSCGFQRGSEVVKIGQYPMTYLFPYGFVWYMGSAHIKN